jgi:hypothetical protein
MRGFPHCGLLHALGNGEDAELGALGVRQPVHRQTARKVDIDGLRLGRDLVGRFPDAGGHLRWFVLAAWLCLVAGAAALGSLATAWVIKALEKPEGGPAG